MSLRQLCPELAEKAKLELNEDPKTIEGDIQHIKDWLAKQPHLKVRTGKVKKTVLLEMCVILRPL